jgi:uncharacterized low-complexity protein
MSNKIVNTLTVAIGAALLGSVSIASAANAFQVTDLGQGYQLVGDEKPADQKCGEAKCGADKKDGEAKCGEGKCGGEKKDAKAEGEKKCGEGKCGG